MSEPFKTRQNSQSRLPNGPERKHCPAAVSGQNNIWDAKMSLDADGSKYSRQHAGNGVDQPQTSLRIKGVSIDAAKVPFIVIPLDTSAANSFKRETGIGLGDLAAVISNGKLSYAIVADEEPSCRIGEGSMRLHEKLGHKVCCDEKCLDLHDVSIESDVLYFVFPGTDIQKVPGLSLQNLNATIESEGKRLFDSFSYPPDQK
jgi:Fungal chitosanase of glycosyl hydrolase group 75